LSFPSIAEGWIMLHAGKWLLAVVVGVGFAGIATADETKGPDLSDLRDAVKAASKRGDNVLEIRKALDTLEKFLAKGWTAPNGGTVSPPPELSALRDAVEIALKKGENVDAIDKELEVVEKAMTGQAFVRPAPPPPVEPQKLIPTAPFRGGGVVIVGGGFGGGRGGFGGGRGGGMPNITINGNGTSTSITLNNGEFTIKSSENGIRYLLTGTIGADGPELAKATINDGEKKPVEATSLKEVPEDYRANVEKLLKTIRSR
jgi:hypothetical protein